MPEQLKQEVWGLLLDLNLSSTKESQITFSYSRLNYLNAHNEHLDNCSENYCQIRAKLC